MVFSMSYKLLSLQLYYGISIDLIMKYNLEAIMVIKSTIPVGYMKSIRKKIGNKNILFSSEFLKEPKLLYDNLYSSRIIVGTDLFGMD